MEKYTYNELNEKLQIKARSMVLKRRHSDICEYLLENKYNIENIREYIEKSMKINIFSDFDCVWSEKSYFSFIMAATAESAKDFGLKDYQIESIDKIEPYLEILASTEKNTICQHSFDIDKDTIEEYKNGLFDKMTEIINELNLLRRKCIDEITKYDIENYINDSNIQFDKYANIK